MTDSTHKPGDGCEKRVAEQLEQFAAALRAYADNEYCIGIRMAGWHDACLGWEHKVAKGKFGRVEHEAHEKMNKHFGAHYGIHAAVTQALLSIAPAVTKESP
jgi:hypothetical protein